MNQCLLPLDTNSFQMPHVPSRQQAEVSPALSICQNQSMAVLSGTHSRFPEQNLGTEKGKVIHAGVLGGGEGELEGWEQHSE